MIKTAFPRSIELEHLIAYVADGSCCSVVGLSNTGKSALLRAAHTPLVRQRFLKPNTPDSVFFYVDCNMMLTMSEQGFYEATLRAVQAELKNIEASPALRERIDDLYRKVVEPPSAFVGPLSFNESVVVLCEQLEPHIVFLFDEFDDPFARLGGRVFLNLRALRDKYGSRLCFVTATERRLSDRRSDSEANEFNELFASHILYLKMLPESEARHVVVEVARRNGAMFEADEIDFVLAQAGGHPGLLCAITEILLRVSNGAPTDLHLALARPLLENDAVVRSECAHLWSQLSENERAFLLSFLTQSELPPLVSVAYRHLIQTGILVEPPTLAVFSLLFEAFARRQFRARLPAQSGIFVDVDSGEVWADGRKVPTLTELEYRLLLLLYGRIDKICDKYQVVESVWGQEYIDEVDDARIEKLVSRLRQKLEKDPANPHHLQTVRGRGYRLISG